MITWFKQLVAKRPASEERLSLVERLFGICPVCMSSMSDHEFTELASKDTDGDISEFFEALRSGWWDVVTKYQEADGTKDYWTVYLLKCKRSPNLGVLVAWHPAELFSSSDVQETSVAVDTDFALQSLRESRPDAIWTKV